MPGPVSRPTGPIAPGQSNMVGQLAHWMLYGSAPGGGLSSVPGQAAAMFNPLHPQGLANLASMFIGGAKDSPLENASWLENYSLPQAMGTGRVAFREGQPWEVSNSNSLVKGRGGVLEANPNDPKVRQALLQSLHDILFGGEVHATGPIPPRP